MKQPSLTSKCVIATVVHSPKCTSFTITALKLGDTCAVFCLLFSIVLHPRHVTVKFRVSVSVTDRNLTLSHSFGLWTNVAITHFDVKLGCLKPLVLNETLHLFPSHFIKVHKGAFDSVSIHGPWCFLF